MLVRTAITLVQLSIASAALGADDGGGSLRPGVAGKPAPLLSVEQWVQSPAGNGIDLASLRGRVVLIDFWATECGPCVASIASWNKLVDRFSDRPVTFLAVSNDRHAETVRKFLRKRPIHGIVGIDSDGSTRRAYGVKGIPATVVIDPQGAVVGWVSRIEDLLEDKPELLERIIEGKMVRLAESAWNEPPDLFGDVMNALDHGDGKNSKPLCLILIRPASGKRGPPGGNSLERRVEGVTLRQIITTFYPVRGGAVHCDFDPSGGRYDVLFRLPRIDQQGSERLLQSAIEATFGITVTRERRMTDVYVMTADPNRVASWEPARSFLKYDPETGRSAPTSAILARMKAGEKFFCGMGTVDVLADGYSSALGLPVVDDTGVKGRYTFCYPWNTGYSTRHETIALAREHLGVTLTKMKQEIEILIVRKATPGHSR